MIGSGRPQIRTGVLSVILSHWPLSMLLFAKNFILRLPKITEWSRFSRPVYRFSAPVRGTLAVRVYHVRPSTDPSPAVNRVPKVPVSSTPEIKSCPSVTDIPFST